MADARAPLPLPRDLPPDTSWAMQSSCALTPRATPAATSPCTPRPPRLSSRVRPPRRKAGAGLRPAPLRHPAPASALCSRLRHPFRPPGAGDTLFSLGCGRLFEGSPAQMWASLSKLTPLPGDTMVYCAHEYTASNARFAAHVDGGNAGGLLATCACSAAGATGPALRVVGALQCTGLQAAARRSACRLLGGCWPARPPAACPLQTSSA